MGERERERPDAFFERACVDERRTQCATVVLAGSTAVRGVDCWCVGREKARDFGDVAALFSRARQRAPIRSRGLRWDDARREFLNWIFIDVC